MALTLAEAAKLSNDVLLTGVVETIIKESPVLQSLPFIEIVGNGLTYNRENAAAAAGFFDVGDTWTESTPTFTQITATLKILGGDADVDNFLVATRSNIQDLEAAIVQLKAKAVQQKFDETNRTAWLYTALLGHQLSYARPPLNAIPPPAFHHDPLDQHRQGFFPCLGVKVGPVHPIQEGKGFLCLVA